MLLVYVLALGLAAWQPAAAAAEVVDPKVEYTFGNQVIFTGKILSDEPVDEVLVSFRSQGENNTVVGTATLDADGNAVMLYDLSARPLRAFSTIEYWFTVTLQSGASHTSPTFTFKYIDNRFDWQELVDGPFRVYWYEGNLAFAQSVLDVAWSGLENIQGIIDVPDPLDVSIYIYTNKADLQSTQQLARDWMAAMAQADLHVMVVSLPAGPEQRLEMERKIPHELMHIMLYQLLKNGYPQIPMWLNEGLASMAELYPTPDYQVLLDKATSPADFLPMESICAAFPSDAASAYQAYAQSSDFTRYLFRQYGSSGLQAALAAYADGVSCQRGLELGVGTPLSGLESAWLAERLGRQVPSSSSGPEIPSGPASPVISWLVVGAVVLVSPVVLIAGSAVQRKETK